MNFVTVFVFQFELKVFAHSHALFGTLNKSLITLFLSVEVQWLLYTTLQWLFRHLTRKSG